MVLFPFFEDIENKTFLVVGGGNVAKGKVERLKQFTDNIIVVAKSTDINNVKVLSKAFDDDDVLLADYVIGATDDSEINKRIHSICTRKNIPVNIVDNPELCTFVFPSLVKRGNLTVGIATDGKSPLVSQYVKNQIENALPDNIEDVINELYLLKQQLKQDVPLQSERANILKNKLAELIK